MYTYDVRLLKQGIMGLNPKILGLNILQPNKQVKPLYKGCHGDREHGRPLSMVRGNIIHESILLNNQWEGMVKNVNC